MSEYISIVFSNDLIRDELVKVWAFIVFSFFQLFLSDSSFKFWIHQIRKNVCCFLEIDNLNAKLFHYIILIHKNYVVRNVFYWLVVEVYNCWITVGQIFNDFLGVGIFLNNEWEWVFSWVVLYLSHNPIHYWHHFFSGRIEKASISKYGNGSSSKGHSIGDTVIFLNGFADCSNSGWVIHRKHSSIKTLSDQFNRVDVLFETICDGSGARTEFEDIVVRSADFMHNKW